jgi:DNA-binding CsgD family transcriptional regulator
MGRAREQGFDVETPLYHGTTEAFEEFDPAKTGSKFGYDKKGFFFSDDPKTARSYSYTPDEKRDSWARFSADGKAMADARTVKTYVRLKDPITLEELAAHPEYKRAPYEDPTDIYDNNRALIEKLSEGRDGVDLRFRGQRLVNVFDPANIRKSDATFDPSQSGSSKLLAGMGASPEAVGGAAGAGLGYFGNPTDANQDGVIDDKDRGLNAMGGLFSGVVGGNIAKRGANAIRGAFKPQSKLMAAKGSYGARPSAMGDMAGHQAAQKQLKELETYRKTAPASERAAVDQEIADLRGFLEGNSPPVQAGFGGPPKPQANALKPVEARREAPRGNKPFNNPSLSQGENKISEMLLNGYEYPAIADEMMTSVDVVKQLAKRAQDKLGDAVKLPRPGMGKRPVGSTKREAAFGLFDEGLDNATIAQRTGLSLGNVRTYRSYWKQESGAPVANVNGASYNPPEMPPRPFEADYPQKDWPNGPPVDAQGRLVFDMEGRPLNQNATIVGRSKAPGVGSQSEADRPLRDKTATIQTLRNTGSEFERTPRENLPGQTDGYWNPSYADNGRFTGRGSAVIADDLDRPVMGLDDQELMTIAHELAHNIDFKTNPARSVDDYNARKWGIDPADSPGKAKVNDQLLRIYRDLNNAPGAEAKIGRPLDRGYQQAEEARELWAEAIRAYMWDPNYIKTVAPDVAFMIRHHVNRNSSLRKTIQFNAIPTIVGVGGLGLGAAALNGQPAEAKTRSSGMRANALAPAQNNRP